jgi:hypothetical protein
MDPMHIVKGLTASNWLYEDNIEIYKQNTNPVLSNYINDLDYAEGHLAYLKGVATLSAIAKGLGVGYTFTTNEKGYQFINFKYNGKFVPVGRMSEEFEPMLELVRQEINHYKTEGPLKITGMETIENQAIYETFNIALGTKYSGKNSDAYAEFIYGLTSLQEFAASAYELGSSKGVKKPINYGSVLTTRILYKDKKKTKKKTFEEVRYNSVANSDIFARLPKLGEMLTAMFKLLKKVLDIIVGRNDANQIWRDVTYAKVLSNYNVFVDESKPLEHVEWQQELSTELLENCK